MRQSHGSFLRGRDGGDKILEGIVGREGFFVWCRVMGREGVVGGKGVIRWEGVVGIEHFPLHPLGTVKPLASPGGRGHGGGGDHATSSSSSKGPGGRINFHPTGIYTKLSPLAGWREDIVCQRDGSGQGDSGSFSWLYLRLPAGEGWLAGAAAGLHPDGRVVASHQEGELK